MSDDNEEWRVVGLQTNLNILPDHQLDSYLKISEDSLRILRISLIVLGIFLSLFGISVQILSNLKIDPIGARGFMVSLAAFIFSVGGSIYTYAVASMNTNNAIPSTEYIDLSGSVQRPEDNDLSDKQLIYKYYWKESTNHGNSIRGLQYILGLASYSLYVAVIAGPLSFLYILIEFPSWILFLSLTMPLIISLILYIVIRLFSGFEGEIALPESDYKEQFDD